MRYQAIALSVFTAAALAATPSMASAIVAVDDANDLPITDIGTGDAKVRLQTTTTSAVFPGLDAWIQLMWIGDATLDAREFEVTAIGSEGVEVGYPLDHEEIARDYTSLFYSKVLPAGGYDFTALHLVVDEDAVDPRLKVTLSYESDSGPVTETFEVIVPIDKTEFDGNALDLATGPLGAVPEGGSEWFDIEMIGLHNASDIKTRVFESNGFGVVYPNDLDHSKLASGPRIVVEEQDHAAVGFDARDLEPGEYEVGVEVTYQVGFTTLTQEVTRTIVVTPSGDTDLGGDDTGTDDTGTDDTEVDEPVETGPITIATWADGLGDWIVDPYGTDTAITGVWGFDQPLEAIWSGVTVELGSTPSGDPGLFTLSGTGTLVGDHDLDSGESSILSPTFALPQGKSIRLDFSHYFSYLRNATPDDSLMIMMITEDGDNKVIHLERAKSFTDKDAKWKSKQVDLTAYAGQDVQFLIVAGDRTQPSYVEAAIDGFTITAE